MKKQWVLFGATNLYEGVAFIIGALYAVNKACGPKHPIVVEITVTGGSTTLGVLEHAVRCAWNEQWVDDIDPPTLYFTESTITEQGFVVSNVK